MPASNRCIQNARNTYKCQPHALKPDSTNVVKQNNQVNVSRRHNVVVNTGGNRRFAVVGGRNYASFGAARQWNWHSVMIVAGGVRKAFLSFLYSGGYWFWNNGWWYPAYGYDPYYSRYVYDGPIYGYGNVAPWRCDIGSTASVSATGLLSRTY